MGFVHLHLHSEYSFLDGSIKIKDLFERVKELGQDSVAITEHGNMHALVQKYKLAKKSGVKLIIGSEIYLCDDINIKDKKRYHFLLLAKNNEGLDNLNKIISIANTTGFYYKPRVDKNILKKYSKGLIATSACIAGDIPRAINSGNYEKAKKLAQEYVDIFGKDNFFLEVHNHGIEEEKKALEGIKKISKELGVDIVAANDAHYLKEDDNIAHDILLCIQTKKKYEDTQRLKFKGNGFYVKSEEEMKKLFPNNPEFLENTVKIANKCNVDLDLGNVYFPEFNIENNISYKEALNQACYNQLDKKYLKNTNLYDQAKKRLNFELSVINKMDFSAYFLIVADFINEAKKFCLVGPGRGSGSGSIVAYLLGITQLEPLKLDLLFERFLNPERISLPDFDVDFGDRDKVLDYIKYKYGEDKVALIGTYGTMMAKAVLKDVARAINIPFETANDITKYITEKSIQDSLDLKDENERLINKKLIEYKNKYPFLFEVAQKLEGTVRQPGIHACGVVWGPNKIIDYMSIFKKDSHIVTQLDKDEVEERGLVKFDFLGLETLNIIQKILKFIGKSSSWLEDIPLDDKNVYKMLSNTKSIGVFQLESVGMRKTLNLIKPTCFDDIIAIVSLYRPGPMQYLEFYANRKHGKEKPVYPHPLAEEILKPTYGIMVYQEQVMQLAQKLAGFTMGEADVLRKAIGKKKLDLMQKMEGKFKKGCQKTAKMEKRNVDKLWNDIVKFAAYSFNKSHAAAYGLISYRTAYLKYYYPLEFYTAVISSSIYDIEKMAFYIQYAKEEGIKVLPPSINKSMHDFSFEKHNKKKVIRYGLAGVKNVGDIAIDEIIKNRPYNGYIDFINKVDLSKLNKRILKNLIMCGAFDEFSYNRNELLNAYENIKPENKSDMKQKTLFGGFIKNNKIDIMPDCTTAELVDYEVETLGLSISADLLDKYPISKSREYIKLSKLIQEENCKCFILVKSCRQIYTKKGDKMAFIEGFDRTGSKTFVIFPNVYQEISNIEIKENTPLIVEGFLKENSFIVNKLEKYKGGIKNNFADKMENNKINDENNKVKKNEKSKINKNSLLDFC